MTAGGWGGAASTSRLCPRGPLAHCWAHEGPWLLPPGLFPAPALAPSPTFALLALVRCTCPSASKTQLLRLSPLCPPTPQQWRCHSPALPVEIPSPPHWALLLPEQSPLPVCLNRWPLPILPAFAPGQIPAGLRPPGPVVGELPVGWLGSAEPGLRQFQRRGARGSPGGPVVPVHGQGWGWGREFRCGGRACGEGAPQASELFARRAKGLSRRTGHEVQARAWGVPAGVSGRRV